MESSDFPILIPGRALLNVASGLTSQLIDDNGLESGFTIKKAHLRINEVRACRGYRLFIHSESSL